MSHVAAMSHCQHVERMCTRNSLFSILAFDGVCQTAG